jgi:predicted Zn finger-like uncharacterized protein
MSFVTRCTSCGTLFKVVADQLKISDGWVRCGQCATVFDAQANLVEAPPAPPATSAPTPVPVVTEPMASRETDSKSFGTDPIRDSAFNPKDKEALLAAFEPYRTSSSTFRASQAGSATEPASLSRPARSQPISIPADLSEGFSSGFSVPASELPSGSPQPAQLGSLKSGGDTAIPDSQSFRPGLLRGKDELQSDAGPSTSTWASSEYDLRAAEAAAVSFSAEPTTMHSPSSINASSLPEPDLAAPSTTPQLPTPGFVKQAQREQRWRSPWIRLGLSLICLILLAVLAAQIALQEKDRIAAQWPQTKPWLQQLCAQAGCQVQDLKRIESIAVDASSFNRINKNNAQLEAVTQSYRLAVTLKNTGSLPVALPHVELSLQDQQDQPILRRVLSPADLGSSLTALAPAQDMAGSLTLQIDTAQLAGSKIQGYRVLAFYP